MVLTAVNAEAGETGSLAMATRVVLMVEYDGTRYYGFQLQATLPTIQGELEKALADAGLDLGENGIGFALSEEIVSEGGQVLNGNFSDYAIPKADHLPRVESIFVETIDPHGPYGAKGVSECSTLPPAPAIANAIYNAVGVRIPSLPITPEKIVRALQAKQAAKA